MAHIEKSVLIEAPMEQVIKYSTHIPSITEWWGSLVEVKNYTQEYVAEGVTYDWAYKMMGATLRGTTEYTEVDLKGGRICWRNETGIPSTLSATVEDVDGKTRYTMVIDYTVPGRVLGKIADKLIVERLNEREAENVLHNLKTICEAAASR